MFTKNIKFKNFIKKKNLKTVKILRNIIKDKALLEKYPLTWPLPVVSAWLVLLGEATDPVVITTVLKS